MKPIYGALAARSSSVQWARHDQKSSEGEMFFAASPFSKVTMDCQSGVFGRIMHKQSYFIF